MGELVRGVNRPLGSATIQHLRSIWGATHMSVGAGCEHG